MKKTAKFLCALALACASAAAFGADFSAQVAASTLDPKGVVVQSARRLRAEHRPDRARLFPSGFSVFAFFDKAAVKDGDFDIEYSIYSVYPDGKRAKAADNIRLKGKKTFERHNRRLERIRRGVLRQKTTARACTRSR